MRFSARIRDFPREIDVVIRSLWLKKHRDSPSWKETQTRAQSLLLPLSNREGPV